MKSLHPILSVFSLLSLFLVTAVTVSAQEYKEDFNAAQEAAKSGSLDTARDLFASAASGADAASDAEVAQRARYVAAQIDYKLGNAAYKAEDFEAALQYYSSGESIYPAYIKNHYGKGQALNKLGRTEEALVIWEEVMNAPGDRKTSLAAERQIRQNFISIASAALGKRNATRADADEALAALASLTELLEADADVYFYTAQAHYVKGEGDAAISAARQALEIHSGSRSDKAKIYYVLGEAYVSINDRDAAREAFQNAVYGSYKQSAEHYLDTL